MEPEVKFVDSAPVCNFLLQELRLSSSPTASSIYQPRMALSRLASDILSGQNSPAATFGKGLALFLGAVTVVPVIADALTTQLAKHRGQPLFSSSGCIREREVRDLNEAMFVSRPIDSKRDPKLSDSVELPRLDPSSVGPLLGLLDAGLSKSADREAFAGRLTPGSFAEARAMLRNGTPQAVFLDALIAISKKCSGVQAFVGRPDWRTMAGSNHEIFQTTGNKAALLTGATFPHGPDAPLRCQDGAYLGTFSTVVTDGQGGHSADDYDHVRAMQTSVGLMAAETIDQIGKLSRPDSFLQKNHVTLVRLINAAAYAFKPNQEQGDAGVAFTAVADFGWRGVFAFGVGDCTAAVRQPTKEGGRHQVTEFTPQVGVSSRELTHAVGIQPFDDQVVQFKSLGAKADLIYVMSDGVQGFVMKDETDGSSDRKSDEPASGSRLVSWDQLANEDSQAATDQVATALRRKADAMGWSYTDLLVSDFVKDSQEKADAFKRFQTLKAPREDMKSQPASEMEVAVEVDAGLDWAAALIVLRERGSTALAADDAAEGIKKQLSLSLEQSSALDELAERNFDETALKEAIRGVLGSVEGATSKVTSGARTLGQAVNYVQTRALADEARATFARVSQAVGLGSEAEKFVWAALKAERATYIDGRAPDFLAGRDDVTFVCRERQTS